MVAVLEVRKEGGLLSLTPGFYLGFFGARARLEASEGCIFGWHRYWMGGYTACFISGRMAMKSRAFWCIVPRAAYSCA